MLGTKVVIVADDAEADPRIPKDILKALDANTVLVSRSGGTMCLRQSKWDQIKHHFKAATETQELK